MILSKSAILEEYKKGNIIIDPFDEELVNPQSVDVRLGDHFYNDDYFGSFSRYTNIMSAEEFNELCPFENGLKYSEYVDIKSNYREPFTLLPVQGVYEKYDNTFGVTTEVCDPYKSSGDLINIRQPTFILTHTEEFIGTKPGSGLCCELKLKSTVARMGLDHGMAAWIDQGYFNRITMELYSHLPVKLQAGMRIAQVVFHRVESGVLYGTSDNILRPVRVDSAESELLNGDSYQGKYQSTDDLEELKKNWKPEDMLPNLDKIYK